MPLLQVCGAVLSVFQVLTTWVQLKKLVAGPAPTGPATTAMLENGLLGVLYTVLHMAAQVSVALDAFCTVSKFVCWLGVLYCATYGCASECVCLECFAQYTSLLAWRAL